MATSESKIEEKPVTDGLKKLAEKDAAAFAGGGSERIERQHASGKMTARERVEFLLDDGTFEEFDRFKKHRSLDFGLENQHYPGDGVVAGHGLIDGRRVFVFAQDFTVFGGSLSETNAEKICKVMDMAMKVGAPVIGLNDSGGARIQEGVVSLGGYADIFLRNTLASGVVPQISAIMGPCAGGAVYSPAITDFNIMVKTSSYMFITGPDVIKTVTLQEVSKEELGGAMTHNSVSGVAHFAAENDEDCLRTIRQLLSFIPSNNLEDPPRVPASDPTDRMDERLNRVVPEAPNVPYDIRDIIHLVVDDAYLFEVHEHYAKNIVVGFARLGGRSVGIVANQPAHLAGVLDIDASVKAARFAEATVPKITLITRKAYGGAYCVMASKHIRADVNFAYPTAEIAVMGAEGAVGVLYRREIAQAESPELESKSRADEFREKFASPYVAAERGFIDEVIEPKLTRPKLIRALEMLDTKRDQNPPKKHGNIPL